MLNTALNAGIMLAVSAAIFITTIQLVAKGLDAYIHRAEKAKEAAEKAQQAIDASQNTLKTVSSTLSQTKARFLELVSALGYQKVLKSIDFTDILGCLWYTGSAKKNVVF